MHDEHFKKVEEHLTCEVSLNLRPQKSVSTLTWPWRASARVGGTVVSPEHLQVGILGDSRIGRHQAEVMLLGARDQEAVERVAMNRREQSCASRYHAGHRQFME